MNISPRNNFDLLQNFIPYKIVKYKDNKYYININVFVNNINIFGYSLYFLLMKNFIHHIEEMKYMNFYLI